MVSIREYTERDASKVGLLIKNTYSEFNLAYLPRDEQALFLGPFHYAGDQDPEHRVKIGQLIQSQFVFVAEDQGEIVGVLRGRSSRLGSLFVAKSHQGEGIGQMLVERFEQEIKLLGGGVIRVASSMYAVGFYENLGYKKSTGVRKSWSFDGYGLRIQPMRKVIK
ncbi:MAG: GNAT family N-acetyltransferase [Anaerolineales bacterium]|nr:GNAT family N-acetyltransferase [Anaerolineales bacterium]